MDLPVASGVPAARLPLCTLAPQHQQWPDTGSHWATLEGRSCISVVPHLESLLLFGEVCPRVGPSQHNVESPAVDLLWTEATDCGRVKGISLGDCGLGSQWPNQCQLEHRNYRLYASSERVCIQEPSGFSWVLEQAWLYLGHPKDHSESCSHAHTLAGHGRPQCISDDPGRKAARPPPCASLPAAGAPHLPSGFRLQEHMDVVRPLLSVCCGGRLSVRRGREAQGI